MLRATVFARAAHSYWLSVFPRARAELGEWRHRAEQIPDRVLREAALDALLTKRDALEGAVSFAVFASPRVRPNVVRAIVAFELAFDYLDNIVELPNEDPITNGRTLNQALHVAVSPGMNSPDYYRYYPRREDAGYLDELVHTCQTAVGSLPSFAAIAEPVHRALARIVIYQSLNHDELDRSHKAFEEWAQSHAVPGAKLRWWEIGAAAGSQLSVLTLIAAAGDPAMRPARAAALERSYFPWVGALSTLLDGVIDRRRDSAEGQRNLIENYTSPEETAKRLRMIAVGAMDALSKLPDADNHVLILAAMAAFFHSTPQAASPDVGLATHAVLDAMGRQTIPALLLLRARRALSRNLPTY